MQGKLIYEFGPFRLAPREYLLSRQGQPVSLSPQLFGLLVVFVENAGRLLSKEELRKKIWGEAFVSEDALKVIVGNLRKALGDGQNGDCYIETVPRRGYRFIAEVVGAGEIATAPAEISPPAVPVVAIGKEARTAAPDIATRPNVTRPNKSKTAKLLVSVIAALALMAAVFYQKWYRKPHIRSSNEPVGCVTVSPDTVWRNVSFASQQLNNVFIAETDVTPTSNGGDTVVGLTNGPASTQDDLVANIRLNSSGSIDAFDRISYLNSSIRYSPGQKYHLKFLVNLINHTYSAYITPTAHAEQLIGANLGFRSSNSSTVRLTNWALASTAAATFQACEFSAPSFTTNATWTNHSFPPQSSELVYEWDATPSMAPLDTVMTLSNGPQNAFSDMPILVRFGFSGRIEARKGSTFDSDIVMDYLAGATYHFRLVASLPEHMYSAFVTPPGSSEVALALNYPFRSGAEGVNELNTFNVISDWPQGSTRIGNFGLTSPRVDRFGISEVHPTAPGGREWSANWDNGIQRRFAASAAGSWDPYDPEFQIRGAFHDVDIGSGVLVFKGAGASDAPRVYVWDRNRRKKWKNVEVTFYGKRGTSDSANPNDADPHPGFIAGVRSEHQDADPNVPCNNQGGRALYGRMLYNGETKFQKEVVYRRYFSVNKPLEDALADWPGGEIPAGQWIGYKFTALNVADNKNVQLTLYRDETGGVNGGHWQVPLVQAVQSTTPATAIDDGTWQGEPAGPHQWTAQQVERACGFSASKAFTDPGTSVFIRNDATHETQYKKFTIREIAPDPAQYNFETDTQGWEVLAGTMIANVAVSGAHSYYGDKSLAVSFAGPHVRKSQVYVRNPPVSPGKTVQFHVWCPPQNGLAAISPFVEDGDRAWTDGWQPISVVPVNSWATSLSVSVPSNARLPLSRLGVEFISDSEWSGTCYLDSVGW